MSTAAPATVARTIRDLVVVEGADAATYLQGQLSQDVAALAVGASAPTFVLAPQGKVDGWGRVHRLADDRFQIDVDAGAGAAWAARLTRFLLRTKATVAVIEAVPTIEVRGAPVDGGLAPLGPGVVGADFVGWDEPGPPPGTPEGAEVVDAEAAEAGRIRAGVPRWGHELDADTIPATVGQWAIDASVSFTKGCYTGQELVARIDSRGGNVPRRLVGIEIAGAAPTPGTPIVAGGEELGAVTSSAVDPSGGAVAMAFLPRAVELDLEGIAVSIGGAEARLLPLPLPPAARA
jgi:folate-binding protein YgfZ